MNKFEEIFKRQTLEANVKELRPVIGNYGKYKEDDLYWFVKCLDKLNIEESFDKQIVECIDFVLKEDNGVSDNRYIEYIQILARTCFRLNEYERARDELQKVITLRHNEQLPEWVYVHYCWSLIKTDRVNVIAENASVFLPYFEKIGKQNNEIKENILSELLYRFEDLDLEKASQYNLIQVLKNEIVKESEEAEVVDTFTENQINQYKELLKNKDVEIEYLKAQLNEITEQIKKKDGKIQKIEGELDKNKKYVKDKEEEIKKLKVEIIKVVEQNRKPSESAAEIQLKAEVQQLRNDLDASRKQDKEKDKKLQTLKEQLAEFENKKYEQKIKYLQEELDKALKRAKDAETAMINVRESGYTNISCVDIKRHEKFLVIGSLKEASKEEFVNSFKEILKLENEPNINFEGDYEKLKNKAGKFNFKSYRAIFVGAIGHMTNGNDGENSLVTKIGKENKNCYVCRDNSGKFGKLKLTLSSFEEQVKRFAVDIKVEACG